MRSVGHHLLIVLILIAAVASPVGPRAEAAEQAARILDLRWRVKGEVTGITVRLSAPVRYRTAATKTAVVVDLWTVETDGERRLPLDGGTASAVAVRPLAPGLARVTVHLVKPARFKVHQGTGRLTVSVFPQAHAAATLPRGVTYRTLRVPTGAGRARVHVVTLNPRTSGLTIRPVLGGAVVAATETTSVAAARLGAVAAINGNFYSKAGLPLGLVVIDGRVLSSPLPRRTVFATDARGRPWIGRVTFSGRLVAESGVEVPVLAVNRPPVAGGAAVYTPEYGPFTPPQALVVLIRGGRVVEHTNGRPAIPADGYALATAAAEQHLVEGLQKGDRVALHLAVEPSGLRHALQAGPWLVRGGRESVASAWEGFTGWFHRVRAARSAVGITADGRVLFVTVDRERRGSTGMSLPEMAVLMRRLGARDAVNLDGGSSTTLVVAGRVVSAVPPGGERTVSSMLAAVRRPSGRSP